MAAAEGRTLPPRAWHEVVLQALKRDDIRLVPYVPDRVLTTLIKDIHADPFFTTFPTAREEEAVGIVSGAWMGGMRGAILMQTSGFATLANVLASLAIPYRDSPDHVRVRTRNPRRVQLWTVAGLPHDAAGAQFAGDGAPYRDPARLIEGTVRRSIDQAGHHDAGAGGADPVAAFDRRQSVRQVSDRMSKDKNTPTRNTKVMNRFDLTSRRLGHSEKRGGLKGWMQH